MQKHLNKYLFLTGAWIGAVVLFMLIRFVGLTSVAQFRELDLGHINHSFLFVEAVFLGWALGSVFYLMAVVLDRPFIRRRPYWELICFQTGGNLGFVVLSQILVSGIEMMQEKHGFQWLFIENRLFSANSIVILIYVTLMSILFNFLTQVDRKFGPGNLRKLILGVYHHPREEERIFMFLDMKSSTSHAEHLGHAKFSRLIQDCFIDLSVVIDHQAQIYQYIGDEVILFWDVEPGLRKASCISAYFKFVDRLKDRTEHYQSKYGILPVFKAGIHIGSATVLEVGEIKREIAYLGDVLNTAARIQGKCNEFGENLLISEILHERLGNVPDGVSMQRIGKIQLRGRKQSVSIFSVQRHDLNGTVAIVDD